MNENWDDNIDENLLRGIYSYGFDKPSEIQKKAIVPITSGKDVIVQAQSGTGKTGAFLIGTLQIINTDAKENQIIIVSPTRELAIQTFKVAKELSKYMGIELALLIGGNPIEEDKKILKTNPQVICGCCGRIYDMIRRDYLNYLTIKTIVLDEADELLSFGFKNQVYNIFKSLHENIQVILVSATLPLELKDLTDKFMREPIELRIESSKLSLLGIQQYNIIVRNDEDKYSKIKEIFNNLNLSQCIIYCNSVKRVYDLYDAMRNDNFPVTHIHSNMAKEKRIENFNTFLKGNKRVLISSDLTSRGIDIQQVSIVLNFDIPNSKHTYLHRIGRSGRWGRKGLAINFVSKRDAKLIYDIETWYNIKLEKMPTNFNFVI